MLFGDVIGSRRDAEGSAAWLRTLCMELERAVPVSGRLAGFAFTQGDEIQGLLPESADPFRAILIGSLHEAARPMRWVVSVGAVIPGPGPATQRSGPAFLAAREALATARARRDRLLVVTGEPGADRLFERISPVLGEMLAELTMSQRRLAWLMFVEGLRQADAADRLGVSRATISVAHGRGHLRSIGRLVDALRSVLAAASLAQAEAVAPESGSWHG